MFCHKCGAQSIDDSEFCHKCGAKLITDDLVSSIPSFTKVDTEPLSQQSVINSEKSQTQSNLVTPHEHIQTPTINKKKKIGGWGILLGILVPVLLVFGVIILHNNYVQNTPGGISANEHLPAMKEVNEQQRNPTTTATPIPTQPPTPQGLSEADAIAIVREWLNNHPEVGYPPYIFDDPDAETYDEYYCFIMMDGEYPEYILVDKKTGELYYDEFLYSSQRWYLSPIDEWYEWEFGQSQVNPSERINWDDINPNPEWYANSYFSGDGYWYVNSNNQGDWYLVESGSIKVTNQSVRYCEAALFTYGHGSNGVIYMKDLRLSEYDEAGNFVKYVYNGDVYQDIANGYFSLWSADNKGAFGSIILTDSTRCAYIKGISNHSEFVNKGDVATLSIGLFPVRQGYTYRAECLVYLENCGLDVFATAGVSLFR